MRCFIAIDLPEHVKSKIFHRFEDLFNKRYFKGKITEKENLHLTLKFFGELNKEQIEETKKKLKEISFEKINCNISKTGFFNNEEYIKIIWVDLPSENDNILGLQKLIAEKLPELKIDKKGFSSHITAARVNSVIDKKKLVKEVKKIKFKDLNFEIDKFYLMKSELFRQGPRYRVIEEFNLK